MHSSSSRISSHGLKPKGAEIEGVQEDRWVSLEASYASKRGSGGYVDKLVVG